MSGSGHQVGELAGDHHDHAEDGENGEQHWNHLLSGVVGYVANATRRPGVCQGSITGYCTTQHRWSGTRQRGLPNYPVGTRRLARMGELPAHAGTAQIKRKERTRRAHARSADRTRAPILRRPCAHTQRAPIPPQTTHARAHPPQTVRGSGWVRSRSPLPPGRTSVRLGGVLRFAIPGLPNGVCWVLRFATL